jgi:hypothetical protein
MPRHPAVGHHCVSQLERATASTAMATSTARQSLLQAVGQLVTDACLHKLTPSEDDVAALRQNGTGAPSAARENTQEA